MLAMRAAATLVGSGLFCAAALGAAGDSSSSPRCPPTLDVHAIATPPLSRRGGAQDSEDSEEAGALFKDEERLAAGAHGSVHEAQAAVRAHRRRCPDSAVTVHLHGGDEPFELPRPLELGPEDSGTAAAPVVWRGAAGRAPPVISGGVSISGWTKGGSVAQRDGSTGVRWTAPLPAVYREPGEQLPNSLWIGPTRYHLARLPAPTTDPERHGEYNALQWAQATDPTNHTAEANRWGVVVRTADLPASLLAASAAGTPIPSNVYFTVFHSYDTSSCRIHNITRFRHNASTPTKCCWNRIIQGCNASSECDSGGEGCVASGTPTKKYGPCNCHTCASQGKVYDPASSSCKPRDDNGDDAAPL